MCICDRSKTEFDRAKIKLTGHVDRRHFGHYFQPWFRFPPVVTLDQQEI